MVSITEQVLSQATQGGIKHDHGKPAIHLIDHFFLEALYTQERVHAPSLDLRDDLRHCKWLHIYRVLEASIGGQHVMHNEIALALAFGAAKYSANNWRGGMAWSRPARAFLEHVRQFSDHGQLRDPESGLHPLGHAACCVMFLWWYDQNNVGENDLHEVMFPTAAPEALELTGKTLEDLELTGKTLEDFIARHTGQHPDDDEADPAGADPYGVRWE